MAAKPKPKPYNPEQSKRFIETARELETDDSPEEFERVFEKVIRKDPKGRLGNQPP